MLNLSIHHNVHLTRDQRYSLHGGNDLEIVGISVPVWLDSQKNSSEPAPEIFCKYYLKNKEKEFPIRILKDGYEIVMPKRTGTIPDISDEEWRFLNNKNKKILEEYYKKCDRQVNSTNLLDIKDGGCASLNFREHNKMKRKGIMINVIHFVNINDMEKLTNSQLTACRFA